MKYAFINNLATELAVDITGSATVMTVTDEEVATAIEAAISQQYADTVLLTLATMEGATEVETEVVTVTSIAGADIGITRSSDPKAFASGAKVEARIPAEALLAFPQNKGFATYPTAFSIGAGHTDGATSYPFEAAYAVAERAYAIGVGTMASGESAVAMGPQYRGDLVGAGTVTINGANATAKAATAIGPGSQASGAASVAIGVGSSTNGEYSLALIGGQTFGDRSLAAGDGARANGDDAVALGTDTSAAGDNSLALGTDTSAGGDNSLALAGGNAGSANSVSLGDSSTSGVNAVAIGSGASASDQDAIALLGTATGVNSLAIGKSSAANGIEAIAVGGGAAASSPETISIGKDTFNPAPKAISIGSGASTQAPEATAIGVEAQANPPYSVALGSNAQTMITGGLQTNALSYLPSTYNAPVGEAGPPPLATRQAAMQVIVGTVALDLTNNTDEQVLSFPDGARLFIDHIDVIVTSATGAGGTPAIQVGPDSGSPAGYLAPSTVTKTAVGGRDTFDPLVSDGVTAIRASVATAGTGTYQAKVIFRGYVVLL